MISKTKKPQITHVETKLVVSTTLDKNPLDLSVEHWKSLSGFKDHINIDSIAPDEPIRPTKLILLEKIATSSKLIWKANKIPRTNPGKNIINQKKLNLDTNALSSFSWWVLLLEFCYRYFVPCKKSTI